MQTPNASHIIWPIHDFSVTGGLYFSFFWMPLSSTYTKLENAQSKLCSKSNWFLAFFGLEVNSKFFGYWSKIRTQAQA